MKPRTFFSLCAKFGCLFALGACSPKIADAEAATVPHTLSTLKTADNRPAELRPVDSIPRAVASPMPAAVPMAKITRKITIISSSSRNSRPMTGVVAE